MHTSLRSFDVVDADELIDAFPEAGCTLIVPTHSYDTYGADLPDGFRPERNGIDYEDGFSRPPHDRIFARTSNDVDDSMGAFPRTVVQRPERIRGDHPLSSFTGIGPIAERIISTQRPLDVFAPLGALAKLQGYIVLAGVGLNRMSLLHLAEKRAGREVFLRGANGPDDARVVVQSGSCSEGFSNFEPILRSVRHDVVVQGSPWQIFPAQAALNIATHAIRRDPRITHCGVRCNRCDHQVAGGPLL